MLRIHPFVQFVIEFISPSARAAGGEGVPVRLKLHNLSPRDE
jgi:hypothetical protein